MDPLTTPSEATTTAPVATTPTPAPAPSIHAWSFFKAGIAFCQNQPTIVFWYLLPSLILAFLTSDVIIESVFTNPALVFGGVILVIAAVIAVAINYNALLHAVNQVEPTPFSVSFKWGIKHFWPLFWTGLIAGILIVLGYFLLIIPGILAMVYFYFAYYAHYDEGVTGTKALKASYRLVKNRWLMVASKLSVIFGVGLIVMLVGAFALGMLLALVGSGPLMFILELVFQAAMSVLAVVTTFATARLYTALKATKVG